MKKTVLLLFSVALSGGIFAGLLPHASEAPKELKAEAATQTIVVSTKDVSGDGNWNADNYDIRCHAWDNDLGGSPVYDEKMECNSFTLSDYYGYEDYSDGTLTFSKVISSNYDGYVIYSCIKGKTNFEDTKAQTVDIAVTRGLEQFGMVSILKANKTSDNKHETDTGALTVLSTTKSLMRFYIYANNPLADSPKLYAWRKGSRITDAFPGVTLKAEGNYLYSGSISSSCDRMILSKDSTETPVLTIPAYVIHAEQNLIPTIYMNGLAIGETRVAALHPTYTTSRMRLWVKNSLTDYNAVLHFYDDNGYDLEISCYGYNRFASDGSDANNISYYDAPIEVVGKKIEWKFYHIPTGGEALTEIACIGSTQEGAIYSSGDNAQVFWLHEENGARVYSRINASDTADTILASDGLRFVFQGYFACRNDMNNGYANAATLIRCWIKIDDSTYLVKGGITALRAVEIQDFGTAKESEYDDPNKKTTTYDLYQKILVLEANSRSGGVLIASPLSFGENFTTTIVVVISVIGFAVVLGIFIGFRKRRYNKQ